MVQKLPSPNRQTYLGKGKLEELLHKKSSTAYDVALFDDELSPLQQESLEKILRVKVIDRVALILDIFARRARTREGKLQVELAQHEYLLPRLAGQWSHLERLGGGIGTRGPGESQLETDRRLIRRKIERLKDQLENVRRHRELYRQRRRRSGIPIAALVGYTNSGKSTLLNAFSQAGVLAEDKLFATLDPTTRQLYLPGGTRLLLTDTVGFIHKLPPDIVEAFSATLEELQEATLLLHVVDITSYNASEQSEVVNDILKDLELQGKPRITILNKIDKLLDHNIKWDENSAIEYLSGTQEVQKDIILISATKRWGLKNLMNAIDSVLSQIAALPKPVKNEDAL
jgi:GTP-binding protein HflX